VKADEAPTLGENADSFCSICYTEALGVKPVISLGCKHVFHRDCITQRVNGRWEGHIINFKFCECPSCNQWIDPTSGDQWLKNTLDNYKQLEKKVREKCV
jgi:hypothetical protein